MWEYLELIAVSPEQGAGRAADPAWGGNSTIDVFGRVLDAYPSYGLAGMIKLDADAVDTLQGRFDFIGPLDENHRPSVAIVVETQHLELGDRTQPISVYVTNIQLARIFINYYKSGAVDVRQVFGSGAGGYTFN